MKKETIKKAVFILFVLYIPVLFFILFLYRFRMVNHFEIELFSKEHFEMVNLMPFATIISFFERASEGSINMNIVVRNMASNLLMFVPMGMALPVLFEKKFNKLWKIIDDLILNVVSAVIGYGVVQMKFVRKILKLA